jgi:hypothetical protein
MDLKRKQLDIERLLYVYAHHLLYQNSAPHFPSEKGGEWKAETNEAKSKILGYW